MVVLIENKKSELLALCKKYHVTKLSVFGSVVNDTLKKDSDIDLVVESSMKNKFFIEEVNQTKQQLYVAA